MATATAMTTATKKTQPDLEALAARIFDVAASCFCLGVPRGRRKKGGLTEVEFLALSMLRQSDTLVIGDMQRRLGLLPAQMSRVIRMLEERHGLPLIDYRVNREDKRRIDVSMTPAGLAAFEEYRTARASAVAPLLREMSGDDLDDLEALVGRLVQRIGSVGGE